MRRPGFNRIILAAAVTSLIVLVAVNVFGAFAAANTVPVTRLDQLTNAVLISQLVPTACAGLNITNIVYWSGSGTCSGSNGNNLVLGTPGNDTINARKGNDCIVAGGGNDYVEGKNGNDICIEGPGADTYISCTIVYP
ncbi:MAG: hypothetical protein HGA86_01390 [Anaerolineaceae bacterium]|nr:hypothetical protein [Anaerolineaceae bacterium]